MPNLILSYVHADLNSLKSYANLTNKRFIYNYSFSLFSYFLPSAKSVNYWDAKKIAFGNKEHTTV